VRKSRKLSVALKRLQVDVVAIQETFLQPNAELSCKGWWCRNKNRVWKTDSAGKIVKRADPNKWSGGVAIMIAEHVAKKWDLFEVESAADSAMWVRMQLGQQVLHVACVYCPPERKDDDRWQQAEEVLQIVRAEALNLLQEGPVLIMGDMNAHLDPEVCPMGQALLELEGALNGKILLPAESDKDAYFTRKGSKNQTDSVVDYLLVASPEQPWPMTPVSALPHDRAVLNSDHLLVWARLAVPEGPAAEDDVAHIGHAAKTFRTEGLIPSVDSDQSGLAVVMKNTRFLHKWRQAFQASLAKFADTVRPETQIDEAWDWIIAELTALAEKVSPAANRPNRLRAPWSDSAVKAKRSELGEVQKKFREGNRSRQLHHVRRGARDDYRSLAADRQANPAKATAEALRAAVYSKGSKLFWSILRTATSKRSSQELDLGKAFDYLSALMGNDLDSPEFDPEAAKTAEAKLQEILEEEEAQAQMGGDFSTLGAPPTVAEIREARLRLKNGKSPGLVRIPNELLRYADDDLDVALADLYERMWQLEYFPPDMFRGMMSALHKEGDRQLPANYRLLTLTSTIGKLFEVILGKRLWELAEREMLLAEEQGGFRSKRSTIDMCYTLHELLQRHVRGKEAVYVAFVDVKKAYDTVWRLGLWGKLRENVRQCRDVRGQRG
jgi:endonuclease/exonuclease/phosphatase family metal-dependent hydrolase